VLFDKGGPSRNSLSYVTARGERPFPWGCDGWGEPLNADSRESGHERSVFTTKVEGDSICSVRMIAREKGGGAPGGDLIGGKVDKQKRRLRIKFRIKREHILGGGEG